MCGHIRMYNSVSLMWVVVDLNNLEIRGDLWVLMEYDFL